MKYTTIESIIAFIISIKVFIAFISSISFLSKESTASYALKRAGIAAAKSFSAAYFSLAIIYAYFIH